MRISTGKHLDRRTLLRGAGAAIALPMLEAMRPAFAAEPAKPPLRLAFTYIPNGVTMRDWKPSETGHAFEFSRILKPLEPFRDRLFVLSGLDQPNAEALGDGSGDHARAGATFLTGVHPKKTSGADIRAGVSVDQIVARTFDSVTRLPSLELGCEDSRTVGNCDSGYSCAYTNSISWRSPTTPLPPEINPRIAFERLFGEDDCNSSREARARRAAQRRSILDVVNGRAQRLVRELGAADRRKIDEYLTGVREVERRIGMAGTDKRKLAPEMEKPAGIPASFAEYVKIMFDLQVLAFQSDLTRVSTLVIGREGSVRSYNEIGVSDPHHPLSHHRNLPGHIEKLTKINVFHAGLFAYFLNRLKETKEGNSTMLDRSILVYGSAIADGNSHSHTDLPVLLAGGGGGRLRPGRHIAYPNGTPMTNLYVALLELMDVRTESFGDSDGKLEYLTEL